MRQRVVPLLGLLLTCSIVWGFFEIYHPTFQSDAVLVFGFAVVLQLIVLLMLAATVRWDARALGFLALVQGAAGYFGALVLLALGWIGPPSDEVVNAIRAALWVGSVFVLVGVLSLTWSARFRVRSWFDGRE